MQEKMKLILAGVFARSNMGLGLPDATEIGRAKKNPPHSPRSSAETFCQQFMESDEHEDMFAGEAEMWAGELEEMGEEKARAVWPEHFKLYDDA